MAANNELSTPLNGATHQAIERLSRQIVAKASLMPDDFTGPKQPQDVASEYLYGAASNHAEANKFLEHARGDIQAECSIACDDCIKYKQYTQASLGVNIFVPLVSLVLMALSLASLAKRPRGNKAEWIRIVVLAVVLGLVGNLYLAMP